jgi:hypothetical protein
MPEENFALFNLYQAVELERNGDRICAEQFQRVELVAVKRFQRVACKRWRNRCVHISGFQPGTDIYRTNLFYLRR